MTDAVTHVEFETPAGTAYGTTEFFPLGGDSDAPKAACLVVQPESGALPTRVRFDSPEADKLRKRFPELAKLSKPTRDAAAQSAAAGQAANLSDEELAAEYERRQTAKKDQTVDAKPPSEAA
jgi:hypothetical protein